MKGKVALVTGASRGIGASIAKTLSAQGVRVAVGFSKDKEGALETVSSCPQSVMVQVDVRDVDSINAAFDEIELNVGPVGILINNAGITRDRLLMRMKQEDWEEVIDVDLTGAFRCTKRALAPMLGERWGRIISIGSVVGSIGNPGQANYAAAKAGLRGFSKALSKEVARHGVTVNLVSPGFVDTDLTSALSADSRDRLVARSDTGQEVRAEEVAEAVKFCVMSPSLTGQEICIDGGIN